MSKITIEVPEITIGIDLGNKKHDICVLNSAGEKIDQTKIENNIVCLEEYFEQYKACSKVRVAMEVGASSLWISTKLKDMGFHVIIANARKLRMIWADTNKCDERDAEKIARVARMDPTLLHGIKHRSISAQQMLSVIRAREHFVVARTKCINCVRGLLKSLGATNLPSCASNRFGERMFEYLPDELIPTLGELLEECKDLTDRINRLDDRILQISEESCPEAIKLQQIPGVGPITALSFVLTIDDPKRFHKSRDLGPFLGLTPKRDQSGECDKQLSITKQGDRYLRSLLVGSAQFILSDRSPDSDLKSYGLRITGRGGKIAKKKAVVAIARKLGILMHRIWISGENYDPLHKKTFKKVS
ncbi:transposase IS116/IS110/IS902 [Lentisphaera araneosa HTCC2155]|jgi:transposase|uniref:Transposase IS116/IS110/IS902 n=4 Tax=Lentisphaera araneosa HTCC2155 TaxID=313628 RepID=A6DF61_9BACT|nr:IS110 family transposase [Lentisphaera araneosa]EDM29441.1 transposase IS116/IS110/IS902 [Lentisphaera araneosa HTCC2155]